MTVLNIRKSISKGYSVDAMSFVYNTVVATLAYIMMYTGMAVEPAVILAILMFIDFISGITKAWAVGEEISSAKMKAGAAGKLLLLMIPLVLSLAAKGMGVQWTWIIAWCVNVMILSEAYSFISNVYAIKTKQSLPEWDVVAMIGGRIKQILESLVSSK